MNAGGLTVSSVQRQLREDWDNRGYAQEVSDNIRHIADFLSNFGPLFFYSFGVQFGNLEKQLTVRNVIVILEEKKLPIMSFPRPSNGAREGRLELRGCAVVDESAALSFAVFRT